MLKELYIKNVAVIAEQRLNFENGFQVLTGETGAGKSVLMAALGLLLGQKASQDLIREGSEQAVVEAVFLIEHLPAVQELLRKEGLLLEGEANASELIIKRQVALVGAGRVFINHQRSTVAVLQKLGRLLVDMTAQNDQWQLKDAQNDIKVLDDFLPHQNLLTRYQNAYTQWKQIHAEYLRLQDLKEHQEERAEWLRFKLKEFNKLDIESAEQEEELRQAKNWQKSRESIVKFSSLADQALLNEEAGAASQLRLVEERLLRNDSLQNLFPQVAERLADLRIQVEDIAFEISKTARDEDIYDNKDHGDIDARLFLLQTLKRKHGPSVEEVWQKKNDLEEELRVLLDADVEIERLQKEEQAAFQELRDAAQNLSSSRLALKEKLEKQVQSELAALQMKGARFVVQIDPRDLKDTSSYEERGIDKVQFLISANPGMTPRPLARIASG
ncbi:MAG: hypothetical protein H7A33_05395, partial [Deltaproteobacteria bacterium]|nr:hypothetical protein [Deltaproteobacteria bacterium]